MHEAFLNRTLSRRSLLSALSLLPAARLFSRQQTTPAEAPKYTVDVRLVNLFATVREKSGKVFKGLTKDDFRLEDENRPQTIQFFEQESSLPLTVGLLVDTSGSQAEELGKERSAGLQFFERILRPDRDVAFVIHFDFEVELLQDFTASRRKLEEALDLLRVGEQPQQQRQGQGGGGIPQGGGNPQIGGIPQGGRNPRGGGGRGGGRNGGTKLYDAVLLASEELMSKQKGRKALIVLTDGVDTGSKVTLYQGIRAAQQADTLVYSVLFSDSSAYGNLGGLGMPPRGRRGGGSPMPGPGPGRGGQELPDGKKVLEQIAEETGGRFYQIGMLHRPIDKVFAEIEEDLRNQYNIGFTPDQPAEKGQYRHVRLTARTAKKKDLVVKTRAGYYAG